MNQGKRYDDKFKKEIVQEYKSGKTVKEISQIFNISQSSIYKWCNGENIKSISDEQFKDDSLKRYLKENKDCLRELNKLRDEYEVVCKENEILRKTISVLIKDVRI